MISKSVNYSAGQWDNAALLRGASQVMVGALALAFLLGVAVLFAFSFILRLWRPRGAEKLPGKWAALLGFMVVVPLLVLWLHRIFGEAPPAQALFYRNGIFTPFAIIVLLNCVGMLALAWLLAGWLVALRSRGEISLAAGLAAGGHALLGACLVALILFYAVHTAHLAWLRTRAVNELTAAAQGDLARFHQDHPELFAEPDLGPYLEIVEGAREMEAAREDAVLEERSEPSGQ